MCFTLLESFLFISYLLLLLFQLICYIRKFCSAACCIIQFRAHKNTLHIYTSENQTYVSGGRKCVLILLDLHICVLWLVFTLAPVVFCNANSQQIYPWNWQYLSLNVLPARYQLFRRSSFPRISFTRSFSSHRQPCRDLRNFPGFSRDLFADKPMSARLVSTCCLDHVLPPPPSYGGTIYISPIVLRSGYHLRRCFLPIEGYSQRSSSFSPRSR